MKFISIFRFLSIAVVFLSLINNPANADFFGGDLPLLTEIVVNTLNTLQELEKQTSYMNDEMAEIKDKISRITTITDLVQPSTWNSWKDPNEAIRRLKMIYFTLPKEYHSEKSQLIEDEISKSMNLISLASSESHTNYQSGKELERMGTNSSPAVATKLTASGMGTMVSMEAQSQVIQSHILSLMTQMLASANERESREVVSKGSAFTGFSQSMGTDDGRFSTHVFQLGMAR